MNTWMRGILTIAVSLATSAAIYGISTFVAMLPIAERPATCVGQGCFCEATAGIFPDQPLNAFSSFAFVVLGVWAWLSAGLPPQGTRERMVKPYFVATMLFLGATSFFYHATLSFFGQFLDVFSMYAFGVLLTVGALYRCSRVSGRTATALGVSALIVLGLLQYTFPEGRRILFALVLLPGIVLEMTPLVTGLGPRSPKVRFIYIGVAIMAVAYVIWILDQNGLLCAPHSLIQGHAIWHVLTAVAAFLVFAHYTMTPHRRLAVTSEVSAGPRH